jgi:hypothetical protein
MPPSEPFESAGQRELQPRIPSDPFIEDSSQLELRVAELEARLRGLQDRRRYANRVVGGVVLGAVLMTIVAGIAHDGMFFGLSRSKVALGSAALAAYAALAYLVGQFFATTKASSIAQDLDIAKAKLRIAHRSASAPQLPPDGGTAPTYFDRLVDINITNLGAYYSLVKVHTNNSFLVSVAAGAVGFALIVLGLIVTYIAPRQDITYIATGSGIVTEFIAAVFFYLYNRTVQQMKGYHDSLLAVQNILLSFKIVGDTRDEAEKTKMVAEMIGYLVKRGQPSPLSEFPKDQNQQVQQQKE